MVSPNRGQALTGRADGNGRGHLECLFGSGRVSVRARVILMSLFFFFQAEDGIRDLTVTGVQTCALPILCPSARRIQGSDAIHRDHSQPPHHAGGRRRVRRHDAGARGLDDRGRAPGPDGTGVVPVPRSLRAAALFALAFPAGLVAQRPAVSPVLARMWQRDTTLTVWLFVRPAVPLARAAASAAAAGARLRVHSRWLHALGADASTAALRQLGRDALLRRIQPAGRWRLLPGPDAALVGAAAIDTCPAGGDPTYGPSDMPYRQLDLRAIADAGYDASGVRVAILDAGFNTADPAFAGVTVTAQHDFVFGDSVVRDEPNDQPGAQFHGTAVWSLFAGRVPGRLRGIAPGAAYLLAKTEDVRGETRIEELNYVQALEWADSIGVDIVSSSLGYLQFDDGFTYTPADLNGHVAVTTVAAESAAAHGILVVTAAGNAGPGFRTLVTPGDADSVITVGAEDSLGTLAGFSSRGPTADGRLKPDLTAPGVLICALNGPNAVRRLSGTSFATPLVAAAAALLKQLHPAPAAQAGTAAVLAGRRHGGHRRHGDLGCRGAAGGAALGHAHVLLGAGRLEHRGPSADLHVALARGERAPGTVQLRPHRAACRRRVRRRPRIQRRGLERHCIPAAATARARCRLRVVAGGARGRRHEPGAEPGRLHGGRRLDSPDHALVPELSAPIPRRGTGFDLPLVRSRDPGGPRAPGGRLPRQPRATLRAGGRLSPDSFRGAPPGAR